MAGKIPFILGLGAGYVLGTRAGRAQYEFIPATTCEPSTATTSYLYPSKLSVALLKASIASLFSAGSIASFIAQPPIIGAGSSYFSVITSLNYIDGK